MIFRVFGSLTDIWSLAPYGPLAAVFWSAEKTERRRRERRRALGQIKTKISAPNFKYLLESHNTLNIIIYNGVLLAKIKSKKL